jgi:hypothetical protein
MLKPELTAVIGELIQVVDIIANSAIGTLLSTLEQDISTSSHIGQIMDISMLEGLLDRYLNDIIKELGETVKNSLNVVELRADEIISHVKNISILALDGIKRAYKEVSNKLVRMSRDVRLMEFITSNGAINAEDIIADILSNGIMLVKNSIQLALSEISRVLDSIVHRVEEITIDLDIIEGKFSHLYGVFDKECNRCLDALKTLHSKSDTVVQKFTDNMRRKIRDVKTTITNHVDRTITDIEGVREEFLNYESDSLNSVRARLEKDEDDLKASGTRISDSVGKLSSIFSYIKVIIYIIVVVSVIIVIILVILLINVPYKSVIKK